MGLFSYGVIASVLAGLATGLGALPVLLLRNLSTSFSLIIPGIRQGDLLWPGFGVYLMMGGIMLGGIVLDFIDKKLPHEHFFKGPEGPSSKLKRIWLFVIAITIHNFPEGMAVGVGFGTGDIGSGISLAIGIGLQNMPEGLAVALPLLGLGYNRWKALGIATVTGLVEPIGGLLGAGAVTLFTPVLPLALAFAAGAMLFVISDEIIPETHAEGKSRPATYGVLIGFIVMMALDNLLG